MKSFILLLLYYTALILPISSAKWFHFNRNNQLAASTGTGIVSHNKNIEIESVANGNSQQEATTGTLQDTTSTPVLDTDTALPTSKEQPQNQNSDTHTTAEIPTSKTENQDPTDANGPAQTSVTQQTSPTDINIQSNTAHGQTTQTVESLWPAHSDTTTINTDTREHTSTNVVPTDPAVQLHTTEATSMTVPTTTAEPASTTPQETTPMTTAETTTTPETTPTTTPKTASTTPQETTPTTTPETTTTFTPETTPTTTPTTTAPITVSTTTPALESMPTTTSEIMATTTPETTPTATPKTTPTATAETTPTTTPETTTTFTPETTPRTTPKITPETTAETASTTPQEITPTTTAETTTTPETTPTTTPKITPTTTAETTTTPKTTDTTTPETTPTATPTTTAPMTVSTTTPALESTPTTTPESTLTTTPETTTTFTPETTPTTTPTTTAPMTVSTTTPALESTPTTTPESTPTTTPEITATTTPETTPTAAPTTTLTATPETTPKITRTTTPTATAETMPSTTAETTPMTVSTTIPTNTPTTTPTTTVLSITPPATSQATTQYTDASQVPDTFAVTGSTTRSTLLPASTPRDPDETTDDINPIFSSTEVLPTLIASNDEEVRTTTSPTYPITTNTIITTTSRIAENSAGQLVSDIDTESYSTLESIAEQLTDWVEPTVQSTTQSVLNTQTKTGQAVEESTTETQTYDSQHVNEGVSFGATTRTYDEDFKLSVTSTATTNTPMSNGDALDKENQSSETYESVSEPNSESVRLNGNAASTLAHIMTDSTATSAPAAEAKPTSTSTRISGVVSSKTDRVTPTISRTLVSGSKGISNVVPQATLQQSSVSVTDTMVSSITGSVGVVQTPNPLGGSSILNPASPTSGSDSTDTVWLPTNIIIASNADSTHTARAESTASLPAAIAPAEELQSPPDFELITIGFLSGLNYAFLVGNPLSSAQVFDFLPHVLFFPIEDAAEKSKAIQPQSSDITTTLVAPLRKNRKTVTDMTRANVVNQNEATSSSLNLAVSSEATGSNDVELIFKNIRVKQIIPLVIEGNDYITSVAEVYFPTIYIDSLSALISDPNSTLYSNPKKNFATLASLIDKAIPLTSLRKNDGQSNTSTDSSSDVNSNESTGDDAFQNAEEYLRVSGAMDLSNIKVSKVNHTIRNRIIVFLFTLTTGVFLWISTFLIIFRITNKSRKLKDSNLKKGSLPLYQQNPYRENKQFSAESSESYIDIHYTTEKYSDYSASSPPIGENIIVDSAQGIQYKVDNEGNYYYNGNHLAEGMPEEDEESARYKQENQSTELQSDSIDHFYGSHPQQSNTDEKSESGRRINRPHSPYLSGAVKDPPFTFNRPSNDRNVTYSDSLGLKYNADATSMDFFPGEGSQMIGINPNLFRSETGSEVKGFNLHSTKDNSLSHISTIMSSKQANSQNSSAFGTSTLLLKHTLNNLSYLPMNELSFDLDDMVGEVNVDDTDDDTVDDYRVGDIDELDVELYKRLSKIEKFKNAGKSPAVEDRKKFIKMHLESKYSKTARS
ncbi:Hkr1p KNAG_0C03260 [Huiozyma naganishii CBS 8797]|uniref:Uncharacterized protein n=1 Tax=Huiozyma naganishii (strain ATCC MYA-139 / BCRC 22969 / CBS 8797 / KCTC 17520 / NBRC 10181 / NCYC 3082 / Yp74L-3) TaxID=1071383 RepID=J7R3M9_HUIN7|nr:hypothetical protein KNAG_0C03260 [Kazachstania naganishii CBS 8797]CCK69435.1 hypothetical protein KNAG_0C03260 [Kazachstania naganishii CBS 8797]